VWENFQKAHERYSILTWVEWPCNYSPGPDADPDAQPPPLFCLFKGKKGKKIQQDLKREMAARMVPWFHIQVQEFGSYREEDVIEALEKVLPVAGATHESMIVMLDWFSAHRADGVIALIERRGHVVLFHGGGCTPFTQVNDTHLLLPPASETVFDGI
jgi:hypothetical protein